MCMMQKALGNWKGALNADVVQVSRRGRGEDLTSFTGSPLAISYIFIDRDGDTSYSMSFLSTSLLYLPKASHPCCSFLTLLLSNAQLHSK